MNEYKVSTADSEIRIDKLMTMINPDFSRAKMKGWIDQEHIKVNNEPVKANHRCRIGDVVTWTEPVVESPTVDAEDIPVDIIYEDMDILVVNKAKGMVVHPAPGHTSGTLVNALLHQGVNLPETGEKERPGIVHRLDKDTSGLLVVAKTDGSYRELIKQFKSQKVVRKYAGLVHGAIAHEKGMIDAPIGRDPNNRQRMEVVDDGKKAITHFHVIETFNDFSYVVCQLETGRTHQIRVHMKYIKHPLAGDKKYGPRKTFDLDGQALHANQIGFHHPVTMEWLDFKTELPDYFEKAMERIRSMY